MIAGGYNGGSNTAILKFIQMMILAGPRNRFDSDVKIPLIFCGDTNRQKYINSMLPDHFIVSCTENIRPDFKTFNYDPAKQKIHEVFKDSVMEHAPGYKYLKTTTSVDIKPTPTAVEQMLKLYVEKNNENILVIDMGGSTTDIYSYIKGYFHRTVSANVGLSFSLANILAAVLKTKNIDDVIKLLPDNYEEDDIRNYISNKTINPSYLPVSDSERYLEQLCAVFGFELSLVQHLEMNFNNLRNDFFDRQDSNIFILSAYWRNHPGKNEYIERSYSIDYQNKFHLSDIKTIIGSGGVVAYAKNKEEQIFMLTEGLKPHGITKIIIDKPFKISHMGILSFTDSESALEMFERECLETIAYVIAPTGKIYSEKPVIFLTERMSNISFTMNGGQMVYYPAGGDFEIKSANTLIRVERNLNIQQIKTDLPVLIDCRGREKYFIRTSLLKSGIQDFQFNYGSFVSNIPLNYIKCADLSCGEIEFSSSLPHAGDIFVKKGATVYAGEIIGKNESARQEFFYREINPSCNSKLNYSVEEMQNGLKIKIGQFVRPGDLIFRGLSYSRGNRAYEKDFIAYRSGTVVGIYYNTGLIVFEEPEINQKIELDAAKILGEKGNNLGMFLLVHEGDAVRENQTLARISISTRNVKSPIKGIVKKIDTRKGKILIENTVTPFVLRAYVSGMVKDVSANRHITVSSRSALINGATGFGGERNGKVYFINNIKSFINDQRYAMYDSKLLENKILVFVEGINLETLESAVKLKVAGIIAPSISSRDWSRFYKKEMNVFFTGDEQFGFSLVLIKGFGCMKLEDDVIELLRTYHDKEISINGRTQIRAGIIRPQIILPEPI